VNKTHNFSAILRSCDAAGVLRAHAVPPEGGLELHPHTAAGSEKWVEVEHHATVAQAVHRLEADGFQIVAAHPGPGAADFRSIDFTRPTALVMGAELHGVSDEALAACDIHVVIPMQGMVRSLNVSVATALILYEAMRQREKAVMYDEPRLDEEELSRRLFEWAHPRVARRLRGAGRAYPALDENGQILRD